MVTVTVLSSTIGTTATAGSISSNSPPMINEQSKLPMSDIQADTMMPKTVSPPAIDITDPDSQPGVGGGETDASQLPNDDAVANKSGIPTYTEVYDSMIQLKERDEYKEGITWTNYEPYGTKGSISEYRWRGGQILGNVSSGVGCAAFAFILSDAAFGDLKARVVYGDDKFSKVKVGDILRINNDSHSVIVLSKTAAGVIVAEGNYNKTVHWGRVLSKEEVDNANYIVTRYPENYNPSDNAEDDKECERGQEGNLLWTLTTGGTLTISGTGTMDNFSDGKSPAWSNKNFHTIVIEKGVTSIGTHAFSESQATSVFLPDSLTSIGENAFFHSNIVSVTIPGTVETIGNHAFQNCPNLISVSVSNGVKKIGESAFQGCTVLKYIDFPASITEIGEGAFMECKEMTRVRFMPGSSKVTIGDYLFARCWSLKDVTLPEKADCISSGMFTSCNMLTKLYIPAGISEIRVIDKDNIAAGPFCNYMTEINFAGSEVRWNELQGQIALTRSGCTNTKVNFDIKFPDPFEEDPNDPGDLIGGHKHNWSSSDWNYDENYHWHECNVQGCPVTSNSEKDSYAEHSYGDWVLDVSATSYQNGSRYRDCIVCSYRQTEIIPSYSSGGSGGSSWNSGSGNLSNPVKPITPDKPTEPDSSDNDSGNTDDSPNSSANDGSSSGSNSGNNNVNETDNSNDFTSNQKKAESKLKKQLKTGMTQQIKIQLKTELKKKLKEKLNLQSRVKLKKQLKAKLNSKVRKKLKTQLKKKFGKSLGKEFSDIFNEQFNAQYNKSFNKQFNAHYKKIVSKQKKS